MSMERFRPGEAVYVRQPGEILATLDDTGAQAGVPFMPEMLRFIGSRLIVTKRVEKICDTITPVASRRMRETVFLEDMRCDGAAHGGCQAACRIYWKEAWLTREPPRGGTDPASLAALARLARDAARDRTASTYRCQATEAPRASERMQRWHLGQYVRELTSGNVTFTDWFGVISRALVWEIAARVGWLRPSLPSRPSAARRRPDALNLRPGEWVEVRTADEISRTLDANGTTRGLYFSAPEMARYCGQRFRVRRRVDRIVDERSGKLLELKNDCVELEGMVCDGRRSVGRWFCAREIYPYWREAWLKRVSPGDAPLPTPHPEPAEREVMAHAD